MKSQELTKQAIEELHAHIRNNRADIIVILCDLMPGINGKTQFSNFLSYYTGLDGMRLEVIRDMLLNEWIVINEDGCVEIANMPEAAE